jgi:hypothetical protein
MHGEVPDANGKVSKLPEKITPAFYTALAIFSGRTLKTLKVARLRQISHARTDAEELGHGLFNDLMSSLD